MKFGAPQTYTTISALIYAAAIGLLTVQADAAIIDLGAFGGHEYLYDTGSYSSVDAAMLASQAQGGQLVSITSPEENSFLTATISPFAGTQLRTAWIGLTRATSTDPFIWVSGEPFNYQNWRQAGQGLSFPEPTNGQNETAVVFYVNDTNAIPVGVWGDTFGDGGEPFNAIYEVAPEPSAALLLLTGAFGIAARRRNTNARNAS